MQHSQDQINQTKRNELIKTYARQAREVIREAGCKVPHKTSDEEVLSVLCPCNRVIFEEATRKLGEIEDAVFNAGIYFK